MMIWMQFAKHLESILLKIRKHVIASIDRAAQNPFAYLAHFEGE